MSRELTATGMVLGTPGYMAPEQARSSSSVDARADVFSLGCVLFKCVTGRQPFVADSIVGVLAKILLQDPPRASELRGDVSADLDDLLASFLSKDPKHRPAHGGEAAAAIERLRLASEEELPPSRVVPDVASLTGGEQRVVSLIVIGRGADGDATLADGDQPASPGVNLPLSASLTLSARLGDIAAQHGARLDALVDGSALVMIEGRGAATDMVLRAARCALAIRERTRMPMALATGRAEVAGRLPIGEVAERGARLLAQAMAIGVRIDDATAGLLDPRFQLSGDADGLELCGESEHVDRPRTLLGKATPCVGRERELGTLAAIFDECVAEPVARVVLVTGAAGSGKSRLCREVVARIRTANATVWNGQCDAISQGSALGPLTAALRQTIGVLEGEPLDVRRRKVAARVARNVESQKRARVTAFLGELLRAPFAEDHTPELRVARSDAAIMGDQIRVAWQDFLEAECRVQPVVLVIESLQWGDLATVKLVDLALRNLGELPWMVIAVARPEVHETFPGLWTERGVQEIRLAGLTRRASEKLVRAVLPDLPDEAVTRMIDRATGNAFYLEEIVRAVAEGNGSEALPDSVLAMVQARLDTLDAELRRVLRAASVFGRVFWVGGVAALLGGTERTGTLAAHLATLERAEIIKRAPQSKFPDEQELEFDQAVVRDAAYAMLTGTDRVLGHRLAGEWLEQKGALEPVVLAEHFERGGGRARAMRFYFAAAQQAFGGNDFAAAIDRVEHAVQCGASGQELCALRLVEAEAHKNRGENKEMLGVARAALEVASPKTDGWYSALALVAVASGTLGDATAMVSAADKVIDEKPTTATQVAAWDRIAAQCAIVGRLDLARVLWNALETMEVRIESPWLYRARALRALFEGDPATYTMMSSAAAEAFARAGDVRQACQQRMNAGDGLKELGDYAAAEAALRKAIDDARRMGIAFVVTGAKMNLGAALSRAGKHREAVTFAREAVADAVTQRHARFEGASRVFLASAYLGAGELAEADLEIGKAIGVAGTAVVPWVPCARATEAGIRLAQKRTDDALSSAREAMEMLDRIGEIEEGDALVRLVWCEALEASGDHAAARTALAKARARLLERAEKITDPHYRRTFLENVPEHARTLALASPSASSSPPIC